MRGLPLFVASSALSSETWTVGESGLPGDLPKGGYWLEGTADPDPKANAMAAFTIWRSSLRQLPLSGLMSCPQCRRGQSLGSELLDGPPNRLAISCAFSIAFIPRIVCEGRYF